jgi:hypothetical protein
LTIYNISSITAIKNKNKKGGVVMLMLFIVGKFLEVGDKKYMVLDEAIKFEKSDLKNAVAYADAIGHAYVAMLKDGHVPILVYETDD